MENGEFVNVDNSNPNALLIILNLAELHALGLKFVLFMSDLLDLQEIHFSFIQQTRKQVSRE